MTYSQESVPGSGSVSGFSGSGAGANGGPMFVQYTVFGLDPAYRRLPDA